MRTLAGVLLKRSAVLLVLMAMVASAACSGGAAQTQTSAGSGRAGASAGDVPVTVAQVQQKPMAVTVSAVGNVEPSSTVEIRSQLTAELVDVGFTEGQDVTAGQLLFVLDPRTFEAALHQAEGQLARDTATAKNLEAQRGRQTALFEKGLVSRAEYDAIVGSSTAAQAAVTADTAAVEGARLQLQRTRMVAPVAGRTGALLVHKGALVRANDTAPMVVINQLSPANVSFAVPARLLPQLRAGQGAGLRVSARAPGAAGAASTGTVTFLDNAVDVSTDTIRLKATFPNAGHKLWPGAFLDVTLQLSVEPKAIVVPTTAVQPGQQGQFVYVVKADRTVEARPVTIAWTDGADTVVSRGVTAGETVVTDGQLRLAPGARVVVKNETPGKRP